MGQEKYPEDYRHYKNTGFFKYLRDAEDKLYDNKNAIWKNAISKEIVEKWTEQLTLSIFGNRFRYRNSSWDVPIPDSDEHTV